MHSAIPALTMGALVVGLLATPQDRVSSSEVHSKLPQAASEADRLAFDDYNADGRYDVAAIAPDGTLRLFMNIGDGRFEDITHLSRIDRVSAASFVVWEDYDRDGHVDLLVGAHVGPRHLFKNLGDGSFEDVAAKVGIAGQGGDRVARWMDIDGDGRLDLHLEGNCGARVYRSLSQGGFEELAFAIDAPSASPLVGYVPFGAPTGAPGVSAPERTSLSPNDAAKAKETLGFSPPVSGRLVLGPTPSVTSVTPISHFPIACADSIRDQAIPGSCLQASSAAVLGMLYPLSNTLFVDDSTGRVGIGTTTPTEKLTVAGIVESTMGGFRFPDDTIQTTAAFGLSSAARSYVEVFIPPDVSQGPLPYNTSTRVNFSNERRDNLGEWDTSSKEFTAQSSGLYLVQSMTLFEGIVDGSVYSLVVNSDNDSATHITKAVFAAMPSATGSQPTASVSAHASIVLRLDAGRKIWVVVDHNNSVTLPSLYWRDYNTYLYITRID